jgi:hypothetical protein
MKVIVLLVQKIAYIVTVKSACIALQDIIPQANYALYVLRIVYTAQTQIAVIFVMKVSIP